MSQDLKQFIGRIKEGKTPEKDMARRELIRFVTDHFPPGKKDHLALLTLPGVWWKFEQDIVCKFGGTYGAIGAKPPYIRFVGCERDWELYKLGVIHIPMRKGHDRTVNRHNELDCQVVATARKGNKFVFLHCDIFDYMKVPHRPKDVIWLDLTVPITHIADKLQYLDNITEAGAMVALTLLKGREATEMPVARIEYVTGLMSSLGFGVAHTYEYFDTSPMLQLIFVKQ